MISLFDQPRTHAVSTRQPSRWPSIKRAGQDAIGELINYYRQPWTVGSSHVLVQILGALGCDMSIDPADYAAAASTHLPRICNALGIANPQCNFGKPISRLGHHGFFSPDDCEILLSIERPFNADEVYKNWKTECSFFAVEHQKLNLSVHVPATAFNRSAHHKDRAGLTVMCVDIPKMAVQYKGFIDSMKLSDSIESNAQFVANFVIPNALVSVAEITLFNRFAHYVLNGTLAPASMNLHPFGVTKAWLDWTDDVTPEVAALAAGGSLQLDHILQAFPSFFYGDALHALRLPHVPKTAYTHWLGHVSRIRHYTVLMSVTKNPSEVYSRNIADVNHFLRGCRVGAALQTAEAQLRDYPSVVQSVRNGLSLLEGVAK